MRPRSSTESEAFWLRCEATAILALVAILFLGWATKTEVLLAFIPHGIPVTFAAAMCLTLSAIGLFCFVQKIPGAAAGCGCSIAAIALVDLTIAFRNSGESATHSLLRTGGSIDFAREHWVPPNTALAFLLVGISLLLRGSGPRASRASATLDGLIIAFAILPALNFLVLLFYPDSGHLYHGMALPTALALIIFASSRFSRHGASVDRPSASLPFIAAALGILISIGVITLQSNAELVLANQAVTHSYTVQSKLDYLISELARMDSTARAYALTGGDFYLQRYDFHGSEVTTSLRELAPLVRDNATQREFANNLASLAEEKFRQNQDFINRRRQGSAAAAADFLVNLPASVSADLLAIADKMKKQETLLLGRRDEEKNVVERTTRAEEILGSVVAVGLMTAALYTARKASRAQVTAEQSLLDLNESLEHRIAERTEALVRTNAQLVASEADLRFLADAMPQLVWTAGPDGRIASVNHAWSTFLHLPPDQIIPVLGAVVHPEDAPDITAKWAVMISSQSAAEGEMRLRRHDGVYRWHLWRGHPQYDEETGKVVRWVGTSTDIHDQKIAAARLEQRVAERTAELASSEERFRSAFEFAGIGMALVGLDGRWLRINQAICQIVGYSAEELMQKTFQEITHPDDLNSDIANVQDLIAGKCSYYQMEKRYVHRDGSIVWINLTASLLRDADGAPVHFISQVEDITPRKKLETNLALARDQALQASRLKSAFLANMSHEIRTPMNGVIGMIGLLDDTPLSAEQRGLTETARISAESLLTIINDILDFSKIEAGQLTIESLPFNLSDPIENCFSLLSEKAHEKGLELAYLVEENVSTQLVGDAQRVQQVLLNLVNNAVKFTEHGEVSLLVQVIFSSMSLTRLRFEVKDTGAGIPRESQSNLFEPFVQADGSITRKYGGTGLGLAICRQLTALMGGRIGFESELGVGSTFWVELPFLMQESQTSLVRPRKDLGGKRVLIVDDNTTSREILRHQLAVAHIQVQTADCGLKGVELLSAAAAGGQPFDLALIDLEMPDLSGLEVADRFKKRYPAAQTNLIVLTTTARSFSKTELEEVGLSACLVKPVRRSQLDAALSHLAVENSERSAADIAIVHPATLPITSSLRILVVEDNFVNQQVARKQLEKIGYRSDLANNGLIAVAAVQTGNYDVVLMDCQMPVLDGFEATRQIRTWEATRQTNGEIFEPVHIVAMTANAMVGDREECFAAGMNDYLSKPVRSADLAAVLAQSPQSIKLSRSLDANLKPDQFKPAAANSTLSH